MIADDTRLRPHHCKKPTASFARLTGIFTSNHNAKNFDCKCASNSLREYIHKANFLLGSSSVHSPILESHE